MHSGLCPAFCTVLRWCVLVQEHRLPMNVTNAMRAIINRGWWKLGIFHLGVRLSCTKSKCKFTPATCNVAKAKVSNELAACFGHGYSWLCTLID